MSSSLSRAAHGVPALTLALLLAATAPVGAEEAPRAQAAPQAETSPTGFAAVNALGQNGTTGGAAGATVTATTTEQFLEYIDTTGPLVIRVQGTIDITSKQGVRPDKTIIGVGSSAVINGGLDFYRSYNVIVRNIRFTAAEDDAVNVGQESHHIWIDHNEFVDFKGNAVYGVASTMDAGVVVEGNHFEGVPKPCYSASGYDASGPGRLVQRNNLFTGSGTCETNGTVTEPRTYYAYTLDPTADVPALVRAGAGVGRIGA
ncbi:pectate lyase family protein [Streptomyces adelaidensis]|uniref:pectate lyase family protein n=1 Tax=Streptomyces adelaidensis TaxID=2796465 RepID=UPI00190384B3|nr:pectate lyase [Streptomyces adelaidensis]